MTTYVEKSAATAIAAKLADAELELERLQRWVNDLQSGMFINCVYCGHQYGPKESTPVSMADVLKEHIRQCPEHPLSAAEAHIRELLAALEPFRHMRMQFDERPNADCEITDLIGGVLCTVGYARSLKEANEFDQIFERARLALERPR